VAGELAMIVAKGLAPLTATGFLTQLTDAVVQDVYHHIQVPSLRVVIEESDKNELVPVAFLASKNIYCGFGHFGHQLLYYLGGIIVDHAHRGIGRPLLQDELEKTKATHLGLHTQNRKMLSVAEKLADFDLNVAEANAEQVGTSRQNRQYSDLPGRGTYLIHSQRYGRSSLYGDLVKFYEQGMNIPGLDPQSGDAVVFVGRIK